MPRIDRNASVSWEGNVARGNGAISAGTGAFEGLPYSLPTRVGNSDGKTSPEELLAAAHAGCLAMSLATELTRNGTPPERLDVHATVTVDEVEGQGHRVVASEVSAHARVPGLEPERFDELLRAADEGCTFSALVRASGTVTVNGDLEGDGDGD